MIKKILYNFNKYKFLLQQLVSRDFKVKYKRSVLGILWSLLYPVLMMGVLAIVFTNVFKMSMPGVNYLVYLISGLVIFNYYSEASNLAMSSVVGNFGLINKVYIPKYIFPLSKCLFVGINFLLTLIPLYIVILATGTDINFTHLLLPYVYICLFMFTFGMGLILATISVFLRDMFYIYGIVIMMWTYLTPIMYNIEFIDSKFRIFFKFNPLYQFINFSRTIIIKGQIPTIGQWAGCGVSAVMVLLFGIYIFRKKQDKFIYYV